jgi:hypothetical protein
LVQPDAVEGSNINPELPPERRALEERACAW